jgi:cytochrome P450
MTLRSVAAIPALPGRHLLGHLPALRHAPLELLTRIAREGGLLRVRLGRTMVLFVSAPALVQELLVEHADDYQKTRTLTRFARPVTGDGILVSQGDKHRTRRAIVVPGFQPRRIQRYADAIVADTDRVLAAFPPGGEVDLGEAMMRLTLHIVASTLICTRVEADVERVGSAFTAASEALMAIVRSAYPLPPHWPTPQGRKLVRAAALKIQETCCPCCSARVTKVASAWTTSRCATK